MKDNSQAINAIESMLEKLRALEGFEARIAPKIAEAVKAELVQQIAAARFPSGTAWPDTQEGKKALRNAAAALEVKAVGKVIVARLNGVEARHSVGAVRGNVQRQILPSAKGQLATITAAVKATIAAGLAEEMAR